MEFKDLFKTDDWKKEKHIPVIDAPDIIKKGEYVNLSISVGKEIPHPNTTEHHIRWIRIYFFPEGEKFPYEIANAEFTAHGESVDGANKSTIYTEPVVIVKFKTEKSGKIFASSYCNIHGLWISEKEIKVE